MTEPLSAEELLADLRDSIALCKRTERRGFIVTQREFEQYAAAIDALTKERDAAKLDADNRRDDDYLWAKAVADEREQNRNLQAQVAALQTVRDAYLEEVERLAEENRALRAALTEREATLAVVQLQHYALQLKHGEHVEFSPEMRALADEALARRTEGA